MNKNLLMFQVCLLLVLSSATAAQDGPTLVLDAGRQTLPQAQITLPLGFANQGHNITALVFSFDLDPSA